MCINAPIGPRHHTNSLKSLKGLSTAPTQAARAVSKHEGGLGLSLSPSVFETHRAVGKGRPCHAPQDEAPVDRFALIQYPFWRMMFCE